MGKIMPEEEAVTNYGITATYLPKEEGKPDGVFAGGLVSALNSLTSERVGSTTKPEGTPDPPGK